MKVKDLIASLKDVDLEMPVYIFADHGQQVMSAEDGRLEGVEELSYATDFDQDSEIKAFVVS